MLDWISYSRKGVPYTKFSITTADFLISCKYQPAFRIDRLLIRCPVLYGSGSYVVHLRSPVCQTCLGSKVKPLLPWHGCRTTLSRNIRIVWIQS